MCEGKVPAIRIRKPKSTREFLWGGSVCENCGCELNKWGEKVSNSTIIGDKYAEKIRLKEAELGSFIDDEVNRRQFELDNQRNKIT